MLSQTYGGRLIQVSPPDSDLLGSYRWRVVLTKGHAQAVVSVKRDDTDRRRHGAMFLSRVVAARAGLDPGRRVAHLNGDSLDCRRENLAEGVRHGIAGPNSVAYRHNPPGLHRHKCGGGAPPMGYALCTAPKSEDGRCTAPVHVGYARRVSPDSGMFRFRLPLSLTGGRARWSDEMRFSDLSRVIQVLSDNDEGGLRLIPAVSG